ncbi:MAG: protein kinase, partial [Methanomicrobiales archaeon]
MADRYTEAEFIGKGGFARVFKAKRKDGVYVAVKLPLYLDESMGRSFIAEIVNWTKLSQPNIVKLYDFNIMPFPYFEEEFCDSSLDNIKKPLDQSKAALIMSNVCEGLKYAHALQVIHCNLKPQNILLKNGVPKISDWGLSKVIVSDSTASRECFTPCYAAPEQVTNKPKDQRTDIWQVGVILYELVTGSLPFTGDNIIETIEKIATRDPVPPGDINPDAKTIELMILRCMEKDPLSRYQSVADLQKDLAVFLKMDFGESLQPGIETKKVCPECSTVHTPSATVCRKCGYQFSRQLPSKDRDIAPAKIGRNDMAVADISPGKVDKATAVDYYSRGCELDKLGRHAEALESYDK